MFQQKVASFLSHLDRVGYVAVDNLTQETTEIALWLLQRNQLKEEMLSKRFAWGDDEILIVKRV
jgi:hypothetical protein